MTRVNTIAAELSGALALWMTVAALRTACSAVQAEVSAECDALRALALLPGERLQMNGWLDHPAWQRAVVHQRFVESAPATGVSQPLLGVMLPEQHQFLTLRPSLAWPAAASGRGLSQHNPDRRSDVGSEMATAGRTGGRCHAATRLLASGAGCAAAGRQYAFCLAAAREAAAFLRVQRPAAHAFRCTLHPVCHPAALGPARHLARRGVRRLRGRARAARVTRTDWRRINFRWLASRLGG